MVSRGDYCLIQQSSNSCSISVYFLLFPNVNLSFTIFIYPGNRDSKNYVIEDHQLKYVEKFGCQWSNIC